MQRVNFKGLSVACIILLTTMMTMAGAEAPRDVWPAGKMPSVCSNQTAKPFLTWFTPAKRTSDAILICVSGGGYQNNNVTGFEVAPMRDYFLEKGVTVVTMRYRYPRPQGLPKYLTAWQDAQRTVRIVRSEALKRGLDPERIGFTGCSAGGHLTLMVATSSKTPAYEPIDALDAVPCHVNWAVPVYPAYGLVPNSDKSDVSNCDNLLAPLVPEFKFDAATPPMCFIHGDADRWSPMVSARVYHKLRTMGIPAELHIMAGEGHCFMDGPISDTPAETWKDRVWEWTQKMHITTIHPISWNWQQPLSGAKLSEVADFVPGTWTRDWRGHITASKDEAIWLKGQYANFILDFEYMLEPSANSGVLIYVSDRKNWIPNSVEIQLLDDYADKWKKDPPRLKNGSIYGHIGPTESNVRTAGRWNRMTIWADGVRVKVAVNGKITVDVDLSKFTDAKKNPDGSDVPSWLSRPLASLLPQGSIGFQGKHGGARPFFRKVRILELGK